MNFVQEHITHPNQSYRVLRLELDGFRAGRHRHRQFELTWIERGSGLRFVGDSVAPFEAGDMVLLGPHLPHAWISDRNGTQALHAATVLQFPPELLELDSLPEMASLRAVIDRAGHGLRIDEPARSAVAGVLQTLPGRSGLHGVAGLMDILGLLAQHAPALAPLASRALRPAGAATAEQDRRVARVIAWVQHNLAATLSNEAAARLVHVSPAAFSRFFRREVGKSFTQYINDVRCSEACLRLRGSDRTVAAIAHECGFDTLSHFNRQFRLRTGTTPRQFRRGR
jgi:AraC-like DNA-binding protein